MRRRSRFQPSADASGDTHHPPRLPSTHVARPRLLDLLERSHERRLTLVGAGAGYGKTTLLAAWARSRPGRVAWASLSASEDDPRRFWAAVVAALRTCAPTMGTSALGRVEAREPSAAEAAPAALANDLAGLPAGAPSIALVLDDCHVIGHPAVHDGLAFLIDHLPDAVRVVVSTRVDPPLPLARWRAGGALAEIRAADLCLTSEEAQAFFGMALGAEAVLAPAHAHALQARTEGWVTGLQLAALALRRHPDPDAFVRAFGGGHRHLADWFIVEVLQPQAPGLRDFLLRTSVLSRLGADACAAVAGGTVAEAQDALATLERANLFIVPLDDERRRYRLHDLFRDALLAQLEASDPEGRRELHRRAARWFAARDGASREAIEHALAGGDFPFAAERIADAAPALWQRGEAGTVLDRIAALPDPILADRAELALEATRELLESVHGAVAAVYDRAAQQAAIVLDRLHAAMLRGDVEGGGDGDRVERRLRLLRALVESRALFKGAELDRLARVAAQAEALGETDEVRWQRIGLGIRWQLIEARQRRGAVLIPELEDAKRRAVDTEDRDTALAISRVLAMAWLRAGQPSRTERECLDALAWLDGDRGESVSAGYFHYYLSSCRYQTDRLDEAAHEVACVLRIARTWRQAPLLVAGNLNAMLVSLARGDHAAADQALAEMESLVAEERFVIYASFVRAARVHHWLATGDLEAAAAWAAGVAFTPETWDANRVAELLLFVRVLLAERRHGEALAMLERFDAELDRPDDSDTTQHRLVLEWLALHALGRAADAHAVAERLLAMTVNERPMRLFLDEGEPMRTALRGLPTRPALRAAHAAFVADLLAALDRSRPRRANGSAAKDDEASLTPREREVYRLLMRGASNAEIAARLAITLATVKKHVGNVLGKLGAQNRVQALARDRVAASR